MTEMAYEWEIRPMKESDPYTIFTEKDSVVEAVKKFEAIWGIVSVSSVIKTAEVKRFIHEEVS